MASKNYLNPCPFCSSNTAPHFIDYGEMAEMYIEEGGYDPSDGWYIICDADKGGCGCNSGWSETQDEAALKWNIRRGQ